LPVDAFIYDFEWYTVTPDYSIGSGGTADFSDFGFNQSLFPEPAEQIYDYQGKGVKFIGIRKPRLGNTANLDLARSKGWLMNAGIGNRDINFSIDSLRLWYATQTEPLLDAGIDAWWDDEGESYYTCYYWWNKTQSDLRDSVRPNDRHFTINRAFSPGSQRMGYCTWNGDIPSTWDALYSTPADLLNWSLSGMYYGTCDIGGFQGNPSIENLVRWFQAAVFFPVMRAHSVINATPRFPWLWGHEGEAAIREALNLRYRLIPFIYSLGHEAYNTGAPIMRPLIMEFQDDALVTNLRDEWLLGKGLLVAPVMSQGGTRSVYLPNDLWYDFQTNQTIQGPTTFSVSKTLDQIPVYVRAGTILPVGPVIQNTGEVTAAPLEIHIYPGHDATFILT
jgi:alpha-glucosidase